MKILRAIGSVFVKIWRWIKNTAWVQPLLIVGAIFGVIFSIPAISNAIQNMITNSNSADTFLHSFQLSMEGGKNSSAEQLIDRYFTYKADYDAHKQATGEDIYNPVPADQKADNEKYFLMFTETGNSSAKSFKEGFEVLRNDWNNNFKPVNSGEQFKLYTIYTDEVTSSTTRNESAFSQFLYRRGTFIDQAVTVGEESNYCQINKKVTEEELEALVDCGPDDFKKPTIILVDWTQKVSEEDKAPGITQIFFNAAGDDSYSRANLLYECWNNKGDFGSED